MTYTKAHERERTGATALERLGLVRRVRALLAEAAPLVTVIDGVPGLLARRVCDYLVDDLDRFAAKLLFTGASITELGFTTTITLSQLYNAPATVEQQLDDGTVRRFDVELGTVPITTPCPAAAHAAQVVMAMVACARSAHGVDLRPSRVGVHYELHVDGHLVKCSFALPWPEVIEDLASQLVAVGVPAYPLNNCVHVAR